MAGKVVGRFRAQCGCRGIADLERAHLAAPARGQILDCAKPIAVQASESLPVCLHDPSNNQSKSSNDQSKSSKIYHARPPANNRGTWRTPKIPFPRIQW